MKRRLLIIISIIAALALCVGIFAGCTESLKQKAISTEFSSSPAGGNGGMTVVYGDYLYFINGYAGKEASNKFGSVVKGSVARVKLEDGVPSGEPQIIVPKNVYGTDTQYGGIYIVDNYIYYSTTSTELDGDGNPKVDKCVIMRTKVDGTDTKEILKLDSHTVAFKVVGTKLVYIYDNALRSVDLAAKKFPVTTIEDSILSGYLMDDAYIYYNVYLDGDSSNYEMKAYPLAGGEKKTIVSSKVFGKENVKYTFSFLSIAGEGDNKVKIFYSKTDDAQGNPEQGVYSLLVDRSTFAYSKENEVRFTQNSSGTTNLNYTAFYKAGPYYYGFASNKLDIFNADGTRVYKENGQPESINIGSSVTIYNFEAQVDGIYLWYYDSGNALHKIKVLAPAGNTLVPVEGNEVKIFSGSVDTSFVRLEKVGNVLYYFNSNISNNAYYYVIDDEKPAEGKEKILGIITLEDIIAAF